MSAHPIGRTSALRRCPCSTHKYYSDGIPTRSGPSDHRGTTKHVQRVPQDYHPVAFSVGLPDGIPLSQLPNPRNVRGAMASPTCRTTPRGLCIQVAGVKYSLHWVPQRRRRQISHLLCRFSLVLRRMQSSVSLYSAGSCIIEY